VESLKNYEYLVRKQFREFRNKYNGLTLTRVKDEFLVEGDLSFQGIFQEQELEDSYTISIRIPLAFPDAIPLTYEYKRIPLYYHRLEDKALCLTTPLMQGIILKNNITLLDYVDKLVIPYLFRFSYQSKYKIEPYKDLPHKVDGLKEVYLERYGICDLEVIKSLLKYRLEHTKLYVKNKCPCGSPNRIGECLIHYEILVEFFSIPNCLITTELRYLNNYV
jgi:hypothetical protein